MKLMKTLIIDTLVLGAIAMCGIIALNAYLNKPMSTEEKLFDRVAYKQMLLKNAEGGIVTHSDEIEHVTEQIKLLRIELAQESFNKRHNN